MKKIALALMLTFMLGLAGCASAPETLTAVSFKIEDAEKLTVMSGSTGKSVDIANEADIAYITDNIGSLSYSKGDKVNGDGWSYSLQWYDENGNVIENLTLLGDGYTVIFDGYYYKGMDADQEIDLKFLEDQFA